MFMNFYETLKLCNSFRVNAAKINNIKNWKPCNIAIISTFLKSNNIKHDDFKMLVSRNTYLENIGFYEALWDIPRTHRQTGECAACSPLTLFDPCGGLDQATETINSYLKNNINDYKLLGSLTNVVGELHDNVCSHGKTFGFSMAQVREDAAEFCIADLGGGFLKVLNKAGVPGINSDSDAIKWCLRRNNTSTSYEPQEDPWVQSLPSDFSGVNPMGRYASYSSGDNHMGVGLAELFDLHSEYDGSVLNIASGETAVEFRNGRETNTRRGIDWKGVAIDLVLPLSLHLPEDQKQHFMLSDDISEILNLIN